MWTWTATEPSAGPSLTSSRSGSVERSSTTTPGGSYKVGVAPHGGMAPYVGGGGGGRGGGGHSMLHACTL